MPRQQRRSELKLHKLVLVQNRCFVLSFLRFFGELNQEDTSICLIAHKDLQNLLWYVKNIFFNLRFFVSRLQILKFEFKIEIGVNDFINISYLVYINYQTNVEQITSIGLMLLKVFMIKAQNRAICKSSPVLELEKRPPNWADLFTFCLIREGCQCPFLEVVSTAIPHHHRAIRAKDCVHLM